MVVEVNMDRKVKLEMLESTPRKAVKTTTDEFQPNFTKEIIEPTTRLIISKMVLINFKSYAGRIEIGPFHKSFSSIVGPNGSGKSNVIDSLLFVFGFRAKKLRQGKLSNLIHKSDGSDLTSCTVEVHFIEIYEGENASLPSDREEYSIVPDSELVVSRSVEKVSEAQDKSTYKINGRTSTYTELTTLLMDKGIDLTHKRFLILQGEVESIALMKPKATTEHEDGLLEYLEDLIGTAQYKPEIENIGKELEEINRVHDEGATVMKFKEREKNSLKRGYEEAVRYLKLENDAIMKRSILYQALMKKCDTKLMRAEETLKSVTNRVKEQEAAKEEFVVQERSLNTSISNEKKDVTKFSAELQKCKSQLQKIEKSKVEWQERVQHKAKRLKKLEDALQKDNLTLRENSTWINNFESDVLKAEKDNEDLEKQLEEEEEKLEAVRNSLTSMIQPIQVKIEGLQQELSPHKEEESKLEAQKKLLESELLLIDEREVQFRKNIEDAKQTINSLDDLIAEKERLIRDDTSQLAVLRAEVESETRDLDSIKKKCSSIKSEHDSVRRRIDETKFSMQSSKNLKASVSSIIQQRDSGLISGICGRLGDLGFIDPRFDVAVTTACGALDNIVVENVESAQKCIEYLRINKLGRASFICLDKMRPYDNSSQQKGNNTPLGIPRLIDLIKPKDKRFMPAFYHALRDTLVAEDLHQANQVAYGKQRWRVVTTKGQLIDISGTMSGGGSKPQSGGMLLSTSSMSKNVGESKDKELSAEGLKKLENVLAELATSLKRENDLFSEIEASLLEKQKRIPKLEMQIKRLSVEKESVEKQFQEAKDDYKRQISEVTEDDSMEFDVDLEEETLAKFTAMGPEELKRKEELDNKVFDCESTLKSVKMKMIKLESELSDLQEEILQVGGVELRVQQSQVDTIKEDISLVQSKLTKLQVEKSSRTKTFNKIKVQIANKTSEIEDLKVEMSSSNEANKDDDASYDNIKALVIEYESNIESSENNIKKMKLELEKIQDELHTLSQSSLQYVTEISKLKSDIKSFNLGKEKYNKLLSELELHIIEEVDEPIIPKKENIDSRKALGEEEEEEEEAIYAESTEKKAKKNVTIKKKLTKVKKTKKPAHRKPSPVATRRSSRRVAKKEVISDSSSSESESSEDSNSSSNSSNEDLSFSLSNGGPEPIDEEAEIEANDSDAVSMDICDSEEETELKAVIESTNNNIYLSEPCGKNGDLNRYSSKELSSVDTKSLELEIESLEKKVKQMTVNLDIIEDFKGKNEEYKKQLYKLNSISEERDKIRERLGYIGNKRFTEFMEGFNIISLKLKEMYQMITMGGNAELELVDSLDPFSEGIVFSVMPPKKSWKNISNLSGGEKTLSSLALVFALHHYKPTPLYVMDEIDAALDFRNVSIVANYIKERTQNAQFIIISLRNNMFELADRLVGIYKTDNKTKSVTIDPSAVEQAVQNRRLQRTQT